MSPKQSCWEIYNKQMSRLNRGDALWEPAPLPYFKRIQLGDVGYIRRGCFHLLFSAGCPLGERRLGIDVPLTFKRLDVGQIFRTQPRLPGHLFTDGVRETRVRLPPSASPAPMLEPGSSISFQLTENQGAALVTKYLTHREDIQLAGNFEKYVKDHYDSWVTLARDSGHGNDIRPVLVTGVDMTRDFAMMSYLGNGVNLTSEFTTSAPGVGSVWGTWRTTGLVHTNCGPHMCYSPSPTQTTDPVLSGNSDAETVSDEDNQCVFVRYYTVRKRLGIPRVIRAAAGPHDLGPGGHDNGESPLEEQWDSDSGSNISAESTDFGSDIVIHNTTSNKRDDFDAIADYVFRNSDAGSVLIHHRDIALLREQGSSTDLSIQVAEKRPQITIDENGVGMIEHQVGPPADTPPDGGSYEDVDSVKPGEYLDTRPTRVTRAPSPHSWYPTTEGNLTKRQDPPSSLSRYLPTRPPTPGPPLSTARRIKEPSALSFIGIVDFAEDAVWHYCSSSVPALLGWDPVELVGTPSIDLTHPDELAAIQRLHNDTIAQDKAAVFTYLRLQHKDPLRGYILCCVSRTIVHTAVVGSVSFAQPRTKAAHNASAGNEVQISSATASGFQFRKWDDPSPMPPCHVPGNLTRPSNSPVTSLGSSRPLSTDDVFSNRPTSYPYLATQSPRTLLILNRFSVSCNIEYCSNDGVLPTTAIMGRPFYDFVAPKDESLVRSWINTCKSWGVNERGQISGGGFGFGRFTAHVSGRDSRADGEHPPPPPGRGYKPYRRGSNNNPSSRPVGKTRGISSSSSSTPNKHRLENEFVVDAIFSAHSDALVVILRRA